MTPNPNLEDGIRYWTTQPASLDGVLGGFGTGTLPRVDSLGSRQFLLYLLPELSTVPSATRPLREPTEDLRRTRALDVGAGIGRVTSDVLLHLVSDVVLLEPVEQLIVEAVSRSHATISPLWKGIQERTKSVTFFQGTLQTFDPSHPERSTNFFGRVGAESASSTDPLPDDLESGFDIVWCQWCLGHLNDEDLVSFFKRSKAALRRPGQSFIFVKENVCFDQSDGSARTVFDDEDSTLTRSDMAWKKIFADAGLTLTQEQVQYGLPEGLYIVKMYALV